MAELESGVDRWMKHYNHWRPHQALGNETPGVKYRPKKPLKTTKKEVLEMAA
ncbi:MAG: transposase [Verrucomicrobiaceae bacterium]|nr:transposase [Verrucomicrobiaceae bacterium]